MYNCDASIPHDRGGARTFASSDTVIDLSERRGAHAAAESSRAWYRQYAARSRSRAFVTAAWHRLPARGVNVAE